MAVVNPGVNYGLGVDEFGNQNPDGGTAAPYEVNTDGGGGGGGGATEAKQDVMITELSSIDTELQKLTVTGQNGVTRPIDFVEDNSSATGTPQNTLSTAISLSIRFWGTGGLLNGIAVPDGFATSWAAPDFEQSGIINYNRPTGADANGFQRVTISYVKVS